MKMRSSFRTILPCALIAFICPCATSPKSGSAALAGRWTNSVGTVWTIRADGTFNVDTNHDGKPDIWGAYTVAGDAVTMRRTAGKTSKDCRGTGVYKFSRANENTLIFTLVSDACKDRKKDMLLAWHQK